MVSRVCLVVDPLLRSQTVSFVLGPNYCALQCLNDGGAFANATFQRTCINAATVNGTCSDACRTALRQVDPSCRAAMQNSTGAELQMCVFDNLPLISMSSHVQEKPF